jgi:hypothetical protein
MLGMKRRLLVALVVIVGCEHKQQGDPEPPPPTPAMKTPAPDPIHVSWTITRAADGKSLTLDYEVDNRSKESIWVLDQIVTTSRDGLVNLPDRVIVRRGPDATTASLVAGFTEQPGHAVEVQPSPVPRLLSAGAKLTGSKRVPVPLASWHPYDSMIDALAGAEAKAVFEVGWLPHDPPAGVPGWEDLPAVGGRTLHLPSTGLVRTAQHLARGETLGLP